MLLFFVEKFNSFNAFYSKYLKMVTSNIPLLPMEATTINLLGELPEYSQWYNPPHSTL
jgi:hypothetical protein